MRLLPAFSLQYPKIGRSEVTVFHFRRFGLFLIGLTWACFPSGRGQWIPCYTLHAGQYSQLGNSSTSLFQRIFFGPLDETGGGGGVRISGLSSVCRLIGRALSRKKGRPVQLRKCVERETDCMPCCCQMNHPDRSRQALEALEALEYSCRLVSVRVPQTSLKTSQTPGLSCSM